MSAVSVIIPTYNRSKELYEVIDTYFEQAYVQQIIVVNDHSTDNYDKVIDKAEKLSDKYGKTFTYVLNEKNMGALQSRQNGLKKATEEYVLWGEDDAFLEPDYTKILMQNTGNKKIVFGRIIYGVNMTDPEDKKIREKNKNSQKNEEPFNYKTFEGFYGGRYDIPQRVPYGHALYLAPKKALDQVDFNEKYPVNGYREETDPQVQLTQQGYQIIFVSEACCFHMRKRADKGGQHTCNLFCYTWHKIKNNSRFYDKYYDYLKETYHLSRSKGVAKVVFAATSVLWLLKTCAYQVVQKVKISNEY